MDIRLHVTEIKPADRQGPCTGKTERFRPGRGRYLAYCERQATWICEWPTVFGNWLGHPFCDDHASYYRLEAGLL